MISHQRRQANRRRAKSTEARNNGGAYFQECKRYDGDGNLIEVISPEAQMKTNTNTMKWGRDRNAYAHYIACSSKEMARIKRHVKKEEKEGRSLRNFQPLKATRKY
jgi:hypothetical protein